MNKGDCNLEYGFYDGTSDPCVYNASDFNGLLTGLIGKDTGYGYGFGVVGNIMTMQVEIDPGFAIIGGIWVSLKTKLIISGYSSTFTCVWFDIDKANKTANLKSSTNSSDVPSENTTGDHLIIYLWRTSVGTTTDYRGSANFPKAIDVPSSDVVFDATESSGTLTFSNSVKVSDIITACIAAETTKTNVYIRLYNTVSGGYKSSEVKLKATRCQSSWSNQLCIHEYFVDFPSNSSAAITFNLWYGRQPTSAQTTFAITKKTVSVT